MNEPPCKNEGNSAVRADGGCLRCEADAGEVCKPPQSLDAIARKVLSYRPKPKSKAAKARKLAGS
jgi:hypothetical protein